MKKKSTRIKEIETMRKQIDTEIYRRMMVNFAEHEGEHVVDISQLLKRDEQLEAELSKLRFSVSKEVVTGIFGLVAIATVYTFENKGVLMSRAQQFIKMGR